MGTRTQILLVGLSIALVATWLGQAAITAVAVATTAIVYLLHTLEVKINRLLDDRGITVTDRDIERE